jgi:hypothetical protein
MVKTFQPQTIVQAAPKKCVFVRVYGASRPQVLY